MKATQSALETGASTPAQVIRATSSAALSIYFTNDTDCTGGESTAISYQVPILTSVH